MANSNLSTYDFHSSNIRVITSDEGVILFCLSDVCVTLKLTNPTVMANQIKDEFGCPKLNLAHLKDTLGRDQEFTMITEPQLYFVMMRSRAKVAREFRQWICNEVIPEIRKRGAYVAKSENKEPATKKCWYVEQLTALFESYGVNREVLVRALDITSRAFKQGYAIGLNNSSDTKDKQPKADDRLTITEDEATAIDHMIYFHDMFKPDVLQVFRKVTKLQSQLAALVCTIQDLPLARLYESATAPEVSCQKLKRFNTTKSKKGELVVSA